MRVLCCAPEIPNFPESYYTEILRFRRMSIAGFKSQAMSSEDDPLVGGEEHAEHQTRLSQLRQIVLGSSLTEKELRYLKILLSSVHVDIISELPIELVRLIVELFDMKDFFKCLAVSRRWRDKLLSDSIMDVVVDTFYPSLRRKSGDIKLTKDYELVALCKIGRRRYGDICGTLQRLFRWKSESFFKLDPNYHGSHEDPSSVYTHFGLDNEDSDLDSEAWRTALYSDGKIAWRAKPHTVIVDDLLSRTRKIFNIPTGPLISATLQMLALGNQLVVGAMDHLL